MRITIEVPDTTTGAFLNYVFLDNNNYLMRVKQISSDDLRDGAVITEKGELQNESNA